MPSPHIPTIDRTPKPFTPLLNLIVSDQVLSMKLLYEFTKREPDFKPELQAYLESVDVESYTTGYRSTRKNILKKLQKDCV